MFDWTGKLKQGIEQKCPTQLWLHLMMLLFWNSPILFSSCGKLTETASLHLLFKLLWIQSVEEASLIINKNVFKMYSCKIFPKVYTGNTLRIARQSCNTNHPGLGPVEQPQTSYSSMNWRLFGAPPCPCPLHTAFCGCYFFNRYINLYFFIWVWSISLVNLDLHLCYVFPEN